MTRPIKFYDELHEAKFASIGAKMKYLDEYHKAAAYLLSLDVVCREHIADLFDFDEDVIRPDGLEKDWQTGTSRKTSRLLFNLWNGHCSDGQKGKDEDGYEVELPSENYAVDNIFNCSYAPYYCEAIRIRFPIFFEAD